MSGSSSTTRMRSPVTAVVVRHRSAPRRVSQSSLNLRDDHLDGDGVVPAARHDDVRIALARLDELQVHRLDGGQVLVEDFVERAAALRDVAPDAANEPDVGVGVDEDFHVAQLAHSSRR